MDIRGEENPCRRTIPLLRRRDFFERCTQLDSLTFSVQLHSIVDYDAKYEDADVKVQGNA